MDFLQDSELYRAIIEDGVLKARRSVLISTANIKNIHVAGGRHGRSLVDILMELARRDVFVHILHAADPSRSLREDAEKRQMFDHPNIIFFQCPRVHFKAVLVDRQWLYLGSANLTGAGLGAKSDRKRNFEMGFVTRDAGLIRKVTEKFSAITEKEMCGECSYRKTCPS